MIATQHKQDDLGKVLDIVLSRRLLGRKSNRSNLRLSLPACPFTLLVRGGQGMVQMTIRGGCNGPKCEPKHDDVTVWVLQWPEF